MPAKDPLPHNGTIRLTIPASVAFDLKALQKSFTGLAERLGCPDCFSGANCFFTLERDFIVNENLELKLFAGDPDPLPSRFSGDPNPVPNRAVNVIVPDKVGGNLKSVLYVKHTKMSG